jgi:hypothetical protein
LKKEKKSDGKEDNKKKQKRNLNSSTMNISVIVANKVKNMRTSKSKKLTSITITQGELLLMPLTLMKE